MTTTHPRASSPEPNAAPPAAPPAPGPPAAASGPAKPDALAKPGATAEAGDHATLLRVTRGRGGRLRVDTRAGLLVPRLVRVEGDTAHVVLLAAGALLLAGDEVRLRIEVGAGARVRLSDVAATVAYDGRGGAASWRAELAVDGELSWHSEPFVVAQGAVVRRDLSVDVAAGARLWLRDTLVFGRHGETGGRLDSRTRVRHDGREVLAEDLRLPPAGRELPGVLRGVRVVDQIVELGPYGPAGDPVGDPAVAPAGEDQPPAGVLRTDLPVPAGYGSLTRWLGTQTHASPLPPRA